MKPITYLLLTNGEGEWCCVAGTNHIGIHFSESPLSQVDHEPINIAPLIEIDGEVWETSWKNYNFTFKSTI